MGNIKVGLDLVRGKIKQKNKMSPFVTCSVLQPTPRFVKLVDGKQVGQWKMVQHMDYRGIGQCVNGHDDFGPGSGSSFGDDNAGLDQSTLFQSVLSEQIKTRCSNCS